MENKLFKSYNTSELVVFVCMFITFLLGFFINKLLFNLIPIIFVCLPLMFIIDWLEYKINTFTNGN